jgi:cytochrome b6-f complex iron-sulfur subunit
MADTNVAAKPTPAPKPAATKPAPHAGEAKGVGMTAAEAAEMRAPITRREFLNYAFLASLGIFFVGLGGATVVFAFPRFGKGEFGGTFDLGKPSDALPALADPPKPDSKARIWLSNTDHGVIALYNVCVHLGCLYQWQASTARFECPCHGSKYQKDGTYIEGPAPRSLDRMVIHAYDAGGKEIATTNATGDPLQLPGATADIVVDTGKIIIGKSHG